MRRAHDPKSSNSVNVGSARDETHRALASDEFKSQASEAQRLGGMAISKNGTLNADALQISTGSCVPLVAARQVCFSRIASTA